jgi:hypothetical protein
VTTQADVLDLEIERLTKACSEMDDETLVFVMLGLLQPNGTGQQVTAGASEVTAKYARTAFIEIGSRWIPLDVFAPALNQLFEDDDA